LNITTLETKFLAHEPWGTNHIQPLAWEKCGWINRRLNKVYLLFLVCKLENNPLDFVRAERPRRETEDVFLERETRDKGTRGRLLLKFKQ
jgi:hypothetical protein